MYLCRELLDDTDSRVAYYSSAFLLKARKFLKLTILILKDIHTTKEKPSFQKKKLFIFCSLVEVWVISEDDDGGTRKLPKHASEACL